MSVGGIRISRLNRKTVLNPTNDIFVMSVQGSATTNGLTFKTLIDNLQAAIAAGPLNAIQFNNPLGELDGSTDFLWDDNAKTLTITGAANASVFNGVALTASGSSLDFLNAEGDYVPVLGSGDMLASVYDPTTVSADAFSMGNMDETATAKVLTNLERLEIAANTSKVSNVTTNLSIGTATATTLDINSSDGTNATIPEAIASGNAGLLSGSNKADIATNNGKVSNVTTNLSIGAATGTTLDVESSDGTNATLPETTALDAGLLSVAKRGEIIANTAKVSNVSTNLSIGTATATTLDVNSSDGTNATLPQAITSGNAGLMSGADKATVDDAMIKATYDPAGVGVDVYNKANETGIEQITGPIITPSTLTATADNYAPSGFSTCNMIRQDINANNREITGFVAPPAGVNRIIKICNIDSGSFDLRFTHNDSGSLAANRILCRDNNQKSIKPNETAEYWYDHLSLRWRPLNRVG